MDANRAYLVVFRYGLCGLDLGHDYNGYETCIFSTLHPENTPSACISLCSDLPSSAR
jgi:hypothetical protein